MSQSWMDSRRLMGPSLYMQQPGAFLEVAGNEADLDQQIPVWQKMISKLLMSVGWSNSQQYISRHPGGAILVINAPPDALFSATELNETAWDLAFSGEKLTPKLISEFRDRIAQEAQPRALKIHEAAKIRGVSSLLDEDGVSIGMGQGSMHWRFDVMPDLENVDWSQVHDIPVSIVTGTNGKTTTVRLLAAMIKASGKVPGYCSTDAVHVADEQLDNGDYSGPAGARLVLRDHRTEVAVLETARGGLLRRGLGCEKSDVAVITNIAADHLGDGGINNLNDLARVKFMIAQTLVEDAVLVTNADDPLCVDQAEGIDKRKFWFSLNPPPESQQDDYCWFENEAVFVRVDGRKLRVSPISEIPLSLNGQAMHNIANVLAATAAALSLGLELVAIRKALCRFGSRPEDNPGRANLYRFGKVQALIDFAHNPDGVKAILNTAQGLADQRLAIVFGQAGDRTDEAIANLSRNVFEAKPELVVVKAMAEFRRGRPAGEVPELISKTLLDLGYPASQIVFVDTELEAAEVAWTWAKPDDLLAFFAHDEREKVVARFKQLAAESD